MCEMGHLVRDHRLQLIVVKETKKALCQDDRRAALPETDRKRVWAGRDRDGNLRA
jgi:hypothetical protein